jgi:hypothetical protein
MVGHAEARKRRGNVQHSLIVSPNRGPWAFPSRHVQSRCSRCRGRCWRDNGRPTRLRYWSARAAGGSAALQEETGPSGCACVIRARHGPGQGSAVFPRIERIEVDASGAVTHQALVKRGPGNRVNEPCRRNTAQVGRTIVLKIARSPDIFGAQPSARSSGGIRHRPLFPELTGGHVAR